MTMKKLYDIRWLSFGGCIKSIIDNIYRGSQALLACLQQILLDANTCNLERQTAQGLLNSILDDEFLYLLYMHHDSHEIVLRPLTKLMQCDNLSYFTLMEVLVEKEQILFSWISESTLVIGPSLHQYIESVSYSAINRIQTTGRHPLKIPTLYTLMTVRMLLPDDIRTSRCQHAVTEAFNLWNSKYHRRRFHEIQVLADVDDDYQLMKLARSVVIRSSSLFGSQLFYKKSINSESQSIKCVNRCKTNISQDEQIQNEAIQFCN
ncbi:unnamed protein product [Rotaria magnacalcarata]|uniref:Uncharacterized protein n=1 Tax=Rotaria magnacalcarata TaxID=392030 RepID=A0A816VJK6_9BILA|nr:unnamed protein product [Rotaria magnacalcarata]